VSEAAPEREISTCHGDESSIFSANTTPGDVGEKECMEMDNDSNVNVSIEINGGYSEASEAVPERVISTCLGHEASIFSADTTPGDAGNLEECTEVDNDNVPIHGGYSEASEAAPERVISTCLGDDDISIFSADTTPGDVGDLNECKSNTEMSVQSADDDVMKAANDPPTQELDKTDSFP
jgi:hypothetical protein